jgi:hypothetical protein
MSQWKISYHTSRKFSPISYWVHEGIGENVNPYMECEEFVPPFPYKLMNQGFQYLQVTFQGNELGFASMLEVDHFREILMQKNLPTTKSLSVIRGTGYGPNNHWLSRLPANLKSWVKREKLIAAINKVKREIENAKVNF